MQTMMEKYDPVAARQGQETAVAPSLVAPLWTNRRNLSALAVQVKKQTNSLSPTTHK